MALLKEDVSLDVERIRKLPNEEKRRIMSKFTREQMDEYFSKIPINEANEPITPVKVNYSMADLLARGWTTAEQLSNMIREKCK